MNDVNKAPFTTSSTERKQLHYEKGTVTIDLNFRIDIKHEMRDLLEILETAIKDIKKEMDARFPNS